MSNVMIKWLLLLW